MQQDKDRLVQWQKDPDLSLANLDRWYVGETPIQMIPTKAQLAESGMAPIMTGWLPAEPIIGANTRVIGIGSCFARYFVLWLAERGFNNAIDSSPYNALVRYSAAFESPAVVAQQFRWAKSTVQTARKLLGTVLTAEVGLAKRIEAAFHMLPHLAYPATVLLTLMLLPALVCLPATSYRAILLVDLPLCMGATGSLAAFYGMAERARGRSMWSAVVKLPAVIALGAGLAPHLTAAVFDGLSNMAGEFVRTPKRGEARGRYRQVSKLPLAELGLGFISLASIVAAFETGHWLALPFTCLFALGYGYVAALVVKEQLGRPVAAAPESVRPPADASVANAA